MSEPSAAIAAHAEGYEREPSAAIAAHAETHEREPSAATRLLRRPA